MPYPNIFDKEVADGLIARVNSLSEMSQRQWGKMDVAKMVAHCNVTFEMIYEPNKHPKAKFPMSLILRYIVKGVVVGEKPMRRGSPTAPQFIMKSDKDLDAEKSRLIAYINKTSELGESHFEGREYVSFGALTAKQYSNMLYKHIDHHLTQFGV